MYDNAYDAVFETELSTLHRWLSFPLHLIYLFVQPVQPHGLVLNAVVILPSISRCNYSHGNSLLYRYRSDFEQYPANQ
jgi:hypothetical protein